MKIEKPTKVLITGGHELGGVGSFADGLANGFCELGIQAEVIPPKSIFFRWRDLRSRGILKILGTSANFAAPFARRAICVAHGYPCADVQGWPTLLGVLAAYKLANISPDAKFVPVSDYTAIHLQQIFDLQIDAVIKNPVKSVFLQPWEDSQTERSYITYVGRLHPAKNIHRLVPAIKDLLDEVPGLRACIIGEGSLLPVIRQAVGDDPRVEFPGAPDDCVVRDLLRRTRVFISGNQTEGFGITYLEALSQGCAVVMPACGGGLEIAPELIGTQVQLMPITLERNAVVAALRRALNVECHPVPLAAYSAKAVAEQYLAVDSENNSVKWSPSRTLRATNR